MTELRATSPGPDPRAVYLAGLIGTLGVFVTGVGEFLMHYSPAGFTNPAEFEFLLQVPVSRMTAGHFLAILAAPTYLLGYWHVTQKLRPANDLWRCVFCAVAFYIFVIAGAWLASRAWLASVVRAHHATAIDTATFLSLLDDYGFYIESLLWNLRIGVLLVSGIFVGLVAAGRTSYPRWFALLNPITLLILVFATLLVPPLGKLLVPAAMNVAHVVFFGVSTYLSRRSRLSLSAQ